MVMEDSSYVKDTVSVSLLRDKKDQYYPGAPISALVPSAVVK